MGSVKWAHLLLAGADAVSATRGILRTRPDAATGDWRPAGDLSSPFETMDRARRAACS